MNALSTTPLATTWPDDEPSEPPANDVSITIIQEVLEAAARLSKIENSREPMKEFLAQFEDLQLLKNRVSGGRGNTLPDFEDAFELLAHPPDEPSELIVGLLHRGMKGTVGGSSKSFKTWTLINMAVAVATGSEWWGFPTVAGRVAYLNFEVPSAFFARRLAFVSQAMDVQPLKGNLLVWNLRGHSAPLSVIGPKIIETIRREGDISLIILDPIYKMMAGMDENSAGDLSTLCLEMDKLATQTGAAIAYGSHFSKGNQASKESIDRISGSGVTARDPDAIITLTKHEEEGAFTVDPILRNHAPVDPFVLRWEFPMMRRDGGLDPAKLKKPKTGREAIYSDEDLLVHLADGAELGSAEWARAVKDECGMSERSFHSKRQALYRDKRIRKSGISGKWCLK